MSNNTKIEDFKTGDTVASHPSPSAPVVAEDIVTDEEINEAWGHANFGDISKREVLIDTLKKVAQGWGTGRTAICIARELGLIENRNEHDGLSDKGLKYLLSASLHSPAERIEGDAVDCVYEIDFGGNLKCRMKIVGNKINVEAAMNGWGDGISIDEIKITELKTPHHE